MLDDHDWRKIQALQDFRHAWSALGFASECRDRLNLDERRRFRCFYDAAVISYCRPFTESKGLPKLSLKGIGIKPTPQEKAFHSRILEHRNKVVAHTDADRMRVLVVPRTSLFDRTFAEITEDDGFELRRDVAPFSTWLRKLLDTLGSYADDRVQDFPLGKALSRNPEE